MKPIQDAAEYNEKSEGISELQSFTESRKPLVSKAGDRTFRSSWISAVFWTAAWTTCLAFLAFFCWQLWHQYKEDHPITIITYTDIDEWHIPALKVKVCYSHYLDPVKILQYNGTEFDFEAYDFLHAAASGNDSFDDSKSALSDDLLYYFPISSRVLRTFATDLDEFFLACSFAGFRINCPTHFKAVIDSFVPCFEGIVKLPALGFYSPFTLFFYFNSSKSLGKYTKTEGAYVTVSDPEEYIPPIRGNFVQGHDLLTLATDVIHKRQTVSFPKSKCVAKQGVETQNFTGEPFDVVYSVHSCSDLCNFKLKWQLCGCVSAPGWNATKTECLEKEENRRCVNDVLQYFTNYTAWAKCKSKCSRKCDERKMRVSATLQTRKFSQNSLVSFLEDLSNTKSNVRDNLNYTNPLAEKLLNRINQSENRNSEIEAIANHIAQCSIFIKDNQPITNVDIFPMVTFATFLSNIGGLLGMWLGLSVIAILELLQKSARKLYLAVSAVDEESTHENKDGKFKKNVAQN